MIRPAYLLCIAFLPFLSLQAQIDNFLYEGILQNNLQQVKEAIQNGADVQARDSLGAGVLMWAAYKSDLQVFKFLRDQGAIDTLKGMIALEENLTYGNLPSIAAGEGNLPLLKYLIDSCRLAIDQRGYHTKTELYTGWTPIQWAMFKDYKNIVGYLFERGASIQDGAEGYIGHYFKYGQYEDALYYNKRALVFTKKHHGRLSEAFQLGLNKIGFIYRQTRHFNKAIACYEEILAIQAEAHGKDNLEYAVHLNNLGVVYKEMGNNEKAIEIYEQSREISKALVGEEHPEYNITLANIAVIYFKIGEYQETIPRLLLVREHFAREVGKEAPIYMTILSLIGTVYERMGDLETAISYLEEVIAVQEKKLDPNNPNYPINLIRLGEYCTNIKEYERALAFFERSIAYTKKYLSETHPNYAQALFQIGALNYDLGNLDKALTLCNQAKDLFEEVLGPSAPEYLTSIWNLSVLHRANEDYSTALAYCEEALAKSIKQKGQQHIDNSPLLSQLSNLHALTSRPDLAKEYYLQLDSLISFQLENRFAALNDQLQQAFLSKISKYFNELSSFTLDHPQFASLQEKGYNQQLLLKGFLQNNRKDLLQNLRNDPNPAIKQQFEQWEVVNRIIARQYQFAVDQRMANFDSLKQHATELEILLASKSNSFKAARQWIDWRAIQQELKPGEVAIEFSQFPYTKYGETTNTVQYVAYVLTPEAPFPKIVSLFEENELLNHLSTASGSDQAKWDQLYASRGISPRKNRKAITQNLNHLIWQPLDTFLNTSHTIYFAPAGLLHRINHNAIPINDQQILSDRYELVHLNSTRSLVLHKDYPSPRANKKALLFGGINYDSMEDNLDQLLVDNLADTLIADPMEKAYLTEATRGGAKSWNYLQGTSDEVQLLEQLFRTKGYEVSRKEGNEATEAYIKRLPTAPAILHIATHGYFFPDPNNTVDGLLLSSQFASPIQISEHPMVRSGIILAGANPSWQGQAVPEGQEDGILTAYEISSLDLSATELVVLSACETGLGDIAGNEGVYGLQRAFKIAGAKYILMSLWQVPDKETQELMSLFYEFWLGGTPIRKALLDAQQQMREKYKNPYFWAGFILVE